MTGCILYRTKVIRAPFNIEGPLGTKMLHTAFLPPKYFITILSEYLNEFVLHLFSSQKEGEKAELNY